MFTPDRTSEGAAMFTPDRMSEGAAMFTPDRTSEGAAIVLSLSHQRAASREPRSTWLNPQELSRN
ncbi:unnamed protein product [Cyprideis torosa]|uniref:Uncharacterized protein n=1 Tax=Cyprideis torosa TaxID=163714 RepID=A0A7R8WS04_9CRUS|nr:unnamed protein product [Cyprideis torosa]CAG0904369.1 unnamed protein product [Cyprideis torosa]